MPAECAFPGCGRPSVGRGYCASHYRQHLRGGPLRPLRGPRGQIGAEPLVRLPGMRGPERVAKAMAEDKAGALGVLVKWTDEREKGRTR